MNASPDTAALLAHVGWVRSLAFDLVADAAEAEDVAQDALVSALEHPPRDPGAWPAYLRALLRNAFLQRRRSGERRAVRERAGARAEALPSAADSAERLAVHREVVEAVEQLGEPYRQTVLLRYFDGLPPREIAARLSVPVKTVNTRLHRAHGLLRERLDEQRGGDRRAWALALTALLRPERGAPATALPRFALGSIGLLLAVATALWIARATPGSDSPAIGASLSAETKSLPRGDGLDATTASGTRQTIAIPERRADLRGRVRTAAGPGIAGAEVSVRFRPSDGMNLRFGAFGEDVEEIGRVRSGPDGEFALSVPEARAFDVHVRAEGFGVLHRPLVTADSALDLVLGKAGTLALEVVDADGVPVAGVPIEVFRESVPQVVQEPWILGRTGTNGRWASAELPPGVFSPTILPPNGTPIRLVHLAIRSGEVVEREVRVPTGAPSRADPAPTLGFDVQGSLRGRGDEPLVGAWVCSYARWGGTEAPTDWSESRTDSNGTFRLAALRAELPHALVVRSPGSATTLLRLPVLHAGASIDLGFVGIDLGASLEGVVLRDDGSPAAGAIVVAKRLDDLPALRVAGAAPPPQAPELSYSATVVFENEGGEAPEVHQVTTLDPAPLLETVALAGDDGRFRFLDLARGRYRIQARIGWLRSSPREFEFAAGAIERDVRFEIARGLALEGSVVDADGHPLPGAWVLLFRENQRLEERSEEADQEGLFRIDGLQDGRFRIEAGYQSSSSGGDLEHPYASMKVLDVSPPGSDIVIRLPRTIRVGGRVVDVDGKPLARAIVNVRDADGRSPQAISDAEGRFHVEVVPGVLLELEGGWSDVGVDGRSSRRLQGKLAGVLAGSGEIVLRLE